MSYSEHDDILEMDVDQLTELIESNLLAKFKGEPYDEERMGMAAEYMIAAKLMASGVPMESVMSALDRPHSVGFKLDGEGLELSLDFEDGDE